jgi:hypothetical protein
MTRLLFRNKWIALIWAISVCLSIARFFGEGGGHEKLLISKGQTQGAQVAQQPHKNPWGIEKRGGN